MSGKNSALNSIMIYKNMDDLARGAARYIISSIQQTISARDRFSLVLSGGSTPRAIYSFLSDSPQVDQVPWLKVHFFWGDERCVPFDHTQSNYRMAHESLLGRLSLPAQNVHRIQGEALPEQAAEAYEQELFTFFGKDNGLPRFDLVLLGMGVDGHTASLFPDSPALEETGRWAVAVEHQQPPAPLVPRVTLTLPLINAAERVAMIVVGAEKAKLIQQVLSGIETTPVLPVQRVNPTQGEFVWLLDEAAAQLI
jgi:6-phosphogluconolactonase